MFSRKRDYVETEPPSEPPSKPQVIDVAWAVETLRRLSPQLNTTRDNMAEVIAATEKLLTDECSIGIPCRVEVDTTYALGFVRLSKTFRIVVYELYCKPMAWINCPWDIKLRTFAKLPDLLQALVIETSNALTVATANADSGQNILNAMAIRSKPDQI